MSTVPLTLERDTSSYAIEGKRVISVTEAIQIAGFVDFSGVPLETLQRAADRGRQAHHATAELDRGNLVSIEPDIDGYVSAWQRFVDETDWTPHQIEEPMVSRRFQFAGTPDRIGTFNGSPALIDLKTSSTIAPWVSLQLAGYEILQREASGYTGTLNRYSLRLTSLGTYRMLHHTDMSDRADFLACVRIARRHLKEGTYTL